MAQIAVINPNSTESITQSIDKSLQSLRMAGAPEISCHTLVEGPRGIQSQEDVESVVRPLSKWIREQDAQPNGNADPSAYVIACFSDPGIALAREVSRKPVLGIAESAFHFALGFGYRFGIIAILDVAIQRHHRYVRQLGLADRLAGDRAIGFGVLDLKGPEVIESVVKVGRQLRDDDGADVLILGCAGLGMYRQTVERELGVPVIDPTQAAVARAIGVVALGYGASQ